MAARPTNESSNYIAFGVQTNKDTDATSYYFLRHLDGSGLDTDPDVQSVREGGGGQAVAFNYKQAQNSEGALVGYSRPEWTGRISAAIKGQDVPSVIASGALVLHRAIPQGTQPYLTIEQVAADARERFRACKISEVDYEYEAGQPLKVTANAVAGGTYSSDDVASAMTASRELVGNRHHFPGASILIDGVASYNQVTKLKITEKRGLDDGIQTSGLGRDDVVELTQDYDVDFTLKYVDKVLYNKVRTNAAAGSLIQPQLPTGSLDIYTAGISNPSLGFRACVPVMEYVGAKLNRLDPDGKTIYLDVSAMGVSAGTTIFFTDTYTPGSASAAFN